MSKDIKIKRGVNIPLAGSAEQLLGNLPEISLFAIKPTDFTGVFPKLHVKEGDKVKAGDPVIYSKDNTRIQWTSPVSGEIASIERGDKRKMLAVTIIPEKEIEYKEFPKGDLSKMDREAVIERLLESGCWPFIRQRPYGIIANPEDKPKSIFISCMNTAPLAADQDFVVHGQQKEFHEGIEVIKKLTEGDVNLVVTGMSKPSEVFASTKGVKIHKASGPHPAGNVGLHIHQIDPVNSGEKVWYLYPQDVIIIGKLFLEGKFDATRIIALAGPEIDKPRYYKGLIGMQLKNLFKEQVKNENVRYISGDPLTGTRIDKEGFLGFYSEQVTVLEEGNKAEFFGWIKPGGNKFSINRAVFTWLMPRKQLTLDTNMHGEERAFVVTGEYEKVFPFDIFPVQLLKSIMIQDVEKMEKLGIFELTEEDMALCEVVCTSKIPVQQILRQGLDLAKEELG